MPSGNLTIPPGTRVECDPRADDQASGIERTRIELIVNQGTFQAMGTEANPIVFTAGWASPTNPPQTGDWYGIRLNSTNASLRFCTVELAMEGLRFEGARPIVEYCTLRRNQRVGADAQGSARLSSCLITLNGGPGIAGGSSNSPMVIENCVVSSNVSSGIAGSFYVTNCTVRNNGDDGVFGPSPNPSVVVLSSVISSNAGYGILSSGRADMIDCVVTENARGGVTVFGGTANITNCTISNNTVTSSDRTGSQL